MSKKLSAMSCCLHWNHKDHCISKHLLAIDEVLDKFSNEPYNSFVQINQLSHSSDELVLLLHEYATTCLKQIDPHVL